MRNILDISITPPTLIQTFHSSVGGGSLWYCVTNLEEYNQILQALIERTEKSNVKHSIICDIYNASFLRVVDKYQFIDLVLNESLDNDILLFESVYADGLYIFDHELGTIVDRLKYGFKNARVVLALPEKDKIIRCATFVDGAFVKGSY